MHPTNIFETPLWIIPAEVPEGMYKWTKEYQRNNPSRQVSNRGGYQSESFNKDKIGKTDLPILLIAVTQNPYRLPAMRNDR